MGRRRPFPPSWLAACGAILLPLAFFLTGCRAARPAPPAPSFAADRSRDADPVIASTTTTTTVGGPLYGFQSAAARARAPAATRPAPHPAPRRPGPGAPARPQPHPSPAPAEPPGYRPTELPPAPAPEPEPPEPGPVERYFQWKDRLEENTGTEPRLDLHFVTQSAVAGPGDSFNEITWRYDLGILQKLWTGARADLHVRGLEGQDVADRFGSIFNTNQWSGDVKGAFVLHLWFEQQLAGGQLTLRGGKMDVGDWIDTNRFGYYNLVGYSQVHNPSIPLAGNPLAAMFTIEPDALPWFYFSAGLANAAQSSTTAGFTDLIEGDTAPLAIAEIGLKIRMGTAPPPTGSPPDAEGRPTGMILRFIGWYDGRDLSALDAPTTGGADGGGGAGGAGGADEDPGRFGVALSADYDLTNQVGLFARYGFTDAEELPIAHYWQVGFDWTGVLPTRPQDSLDLAIAQAIFSDARPPSSLTPGAGDGGAGDGGAGGGGGAGAGASDSETYVELSYNAVVTDFLHIQPFAQLLLDPGGADRSPAWFLGTHFVLRF